MWPRPFHFSNQGIIKISKGWRGGSAVEYWVFLKKTWVQFPVCTVESSQLALTQLYGIQYPLLVPSGIRMYLCTYTEVCSVHTPIQKCTSTHISNFEKVTIWLMLSGSWVSIFFSHKLLSLWHFKEDFVFLTMSRKSVEAKCFMLPLLCWGCETLCVSHTGVSAETLLH